LQNLPYCWVAADDVIVDGEMASPKRTFKRVVESREDANVRLRDLCNLLRALDFAERVRGSHHIFSAASVEELLNLQSDGPDAKPYQVRQVRRIILKYNLRLSS
jgi:hypothetical protein